jgi:hypothetical protein
VVELLGKAIEWQGLIESGDVANQAAIARRAGITDTVQDANWSRPESESVTSSRKRRSSSRSRP